MDQYYAVPPFVSDQVAPNIILVLDNSGSMSGLGCDRNDDGDCIDAADLAFTNTTSWSGYFDSLRCYTYDTGADSRFEPATVKVALNTACSTTEWDGNFLNWATFRRFDALKKAMSGGDCFSARAADGTCPTNGTPALKTVRAQASGIDMELAAVNYNAGAGANTYLGRIPSADRGAIRALSISAQTPPISALTMTTVSTATAVTASASGNMNLRSAIAPNRLGSSSRSEPRHDSVSLNLSRRVTVRGCWLVWGHASRSILATTMWRLLTRIQQPCSMPYKNLFPQHGHLFRSRSMKRCVTWPKLTLVM